jgi:ABC-type taurine transport system ATPase subunit
VAECAANVEFGSSLQGLRRRARAALRKLLDLVGLTRRRRYPHQLSGGMQQRIGLARARDRSDDSADGRAVQRAGRADARVLQAELLSPSTPKRARRPLFVTHGDLDEPIYLGDRGW